MEGREGREGRGEEKARHAVRGRRRSLTAGCCPPATDVIAACATSDLFLKHADEIFATYV
jgi:hypothetical protein